MIGRAAGRHAPAGILLAWMVVSLGMALRMFRWL